MKHNYSALSFYALPHTPSFLSLHIKQLSLSPPSSHSLFLYTRPDTRLLLFLGHKPPLQTTTASLSPHHHSLSLYPLCHMPRSLSTSPHGCLTNDLVCLLSSMF